MAEQGTVVVRAYTSRAQIPVTGATVAVTHPSAGGKHLLVALRVTDESGHTQPVTLPRLLPQRVSIRAPQRPIPYATSGWSILIFRCCMWRTSKFFPA